MPVGLYRLGIPYNSISKTGILGLGKAGVDSCIHLAERAVFTLMAVWCLGAGRLGLRSIELELCAESAEGFAGYAANSLPTGAATTAEMEQVQERGGYNQQGCKESRQGCSEPQGSSQHSKRIASRYK